MVMFAVEITGRYLKCVWVEKRVRTIVICALEVDGIFVTGESINYAQTNQEYNYVGL
jgi:hypothetical protein